ncbi:TPA: hypothetical protein ACI7KY_005130, partial [Escherichia coli]
IKSNFSHKTKNAQGQNIFFPILATKKNIATQTQPIKKKETYKIITQKYNPLEDKNQQTHQK